MHGADATGVLQGVCVLLILLFAIGVGRTWEFVGAKMPGLLGALSAVRRPSDHDRSGRARSSEPGPDDVG